MTEIDRSNCRGFTTLELFVVIGIILVIISVVSLNAVTMINDARRESALSQISAVFRAARQAAQTQNQGRRVVLEVTYSGTAGDQKEAYEREPVLEYWVEKKKIRTVSWDDPANLSPPLDDVQSLPPGVMLVDVNGRSVIPENVDQGDANLDGNRSYKTYVIFNSKGVATRLYRQDDGPAENLPTLQTNIALHLMFGTTDVDLSLADPPGESFDYLDFVHNERLEGLPEVPDRLIGLREQLDQEFRGRTQAQTLYILRLTGQTLSYDYGIYPPWPVSILPENTEEVI